MVVVVVVVVVVVIETNIVQLLSTVVTCVNATIFPRKRLAMLLNSWCMHVKRACFE
jgi:hypothetical protein